MLEIHIVATDPVSACTPPAHQNAVLPRRPARMPSPTSRCQSMNRKFIYTPGQHARPFRAWLQPHLRPPPYSRALPCSEEGESLRGH